FVDGQRLANFSQRFCQPGMGRFNDIYRIRLYQVQAIAKLYDSTDNKRSSDCSGEFLSFMCCFFGVG
ncbi:MAG TPA: hypothetical protein VNW04_00105, partial [Puia sp.]|nr:hypothetical protein [Puia sp.]